MNLTSYTSTVNGGSHWSFIARKNVRLTLTDISGGANVGMIFYNPLLLSEKYNAPDTLKSQHTFKITKGHCLYSDMGRIFASIVEDDFGWHETVCGNSHASHIEKKWGGRSYQNQSNNWKQNGYDSFLVELAKYDLDKRSMAANLNFFSKVSTDSEGNLFLTDSSKEGQSVTLRFDMDTLVLLHTCPHPLNECDEYPQTPIRIQLKPGSPVSEDDICLNHRPENKRGFENNALYHLGL